MMQLEGNGSDNGIGNGNGSGNGSDNGREQPQAIRLLTPDAGMGVYVAQAYTLNRSIK